MQAMTNGCIYILLMKKYRYLEKDTNANFLLTVILLAMNNCQKKLIQN